MAAALEQANTSHDGCGLHGLTPLERW